MPGVEVGGVGGLRRAGGEGERRTDEHEGQRCHERDPRPRQESASSRHRLLHSAPSDSVSHVMLVVRDARSPEDTAPGVAVATTRPDPHHARSILLTPDRRIDTDR
ncbi:hypothetical protein GCM10025877_27300 [Agromyces mangrovi Wang et al. 2018]|nr:hypothetical protein GCM10025877_27300 [Agromyces mangrovi]